MKTDLQQASPGDFWPVTTYASGATSPFAQLHVFSDEVGRVALDHRKIARSPGRHARFALGLIRRNAVVVVQRVVGRVEHDDEVAIRPRS